MQERLRPPACPVSGCKASAEKEERGVKLLVPIHQSHAASVCVGIHSNTQKMAAILQQARAGVGAVARQIGRGLDKVGAALETHPYQEQLLPSTQHVAHKGAEPVSYPAAFVAPTASVIGNVQVGAGSSLWYGSVVRGDVNNVYIGAKTMVGDSAVVHVAGIAGDKPAIIGNAIIIGPRAAIHACTLKDGCMVGAGATVLDGAVVSEGAVVAPGATVGPGVVIPERQMWAGTPASYAKDVTEEMVDEIAVRVNQNFWLAEEHAKECAKGVDEIELDERKWMEQQSNDPLYPFQVPPPERTEEDEDDYEIPDAAKYAQDEPDPAEVKPAANKH